MRAIATTPSILTLRVLWMTALLTAIITLTGCGAGRLLPPSNQLGASLHGNVHGGQQPVAGAHVYLYAANTLAYGGAGLPSSANNASVSLLNPVNTGFSDGLGAFVLTDDFGAFDISSDYSCAPGTQVYLYVHGGDSGGGTNSAIGMLALLGNCPSAGNFADIPYIEVNEVSTIAAAYAFAGYASDSIHVSSNGTTHALTGIANAFATASNLVDLSTGTALTLTPAGNGTPPNTTINTLANILASCVNTTDIIEPPVSASPHARSARPHSLPYSDACIALGLAVSGGDISKFAGYNYDTATAAIFIAQNPGANVNALYTLPTPQAPFSPALNTEPNDFTLGITFTGGGLNYPYTVAVDADGSVWFSNFYGILSKFSPLGAPISPDASFTGGGLSGQSYGLAIDTSGDAWVANYENNSISEFTNTGIPISGPFGFTGDGLSTPYAIGFDFAGDLWVPNYADVTLSRFDYLGYPAPGTGFAGAGLAHPDSVSFDQYTNVWTANHANNSLSKLASDGTPISPGTGYTGGGLDDPYSVAVDASGNAWAANYNADSLSQFSNQGVPLSPSSGFTGGGLTTPYAISFDGAGNVWAANYGSFSVSEFANTGIPITPSGGYTGAGTLYYPAAIATDSSGNVWVTGYGNFVSELVGAAIPIETPIVQALQDFCVALRPCFPPD